MAYTDSIWEPVGKNSFNLKHTKYCALRHRGNMFTLLLFVLYGWTGIAQNPIPIESVIATPRVVQKFGPTPQEILTEEINKRVENLIAFETGHSFDAHQLVLLTDEDGYPNVLDRELDVRFPLPSNEEGYRILRTADQIFIQSTGQRGLQYGISQILREAHYNEFATWNGASVSSEPEKEIRGHQIGYRNTANSYDAWTPEIYEQYIRDMLIFGANSIENIPFADPVPIHFTISADSMNVVLGDLCNKYDMDYWVWTPIEFDLNDPVKSAHYLEQCAELYRRSPRMDAVFVPGGDPGNNPPDLVLPMMEKMAELLQEHHPEAKLWLSMQGFKDDETQYVYDYMNEQSPEWMGGLVAGPSSPPMDQTREALPDQFQLRHYPDITHTVRCQYPNWWWDPAFNFTLGREPINPQPLRYQNIFLYTSPYTDGFVTYSDGMHDDLNKMVWSRLGWDSQADIYDVVWEYANFFLHSPAADQITDGLFALERNWDGAVKNNGSIPATLALWKEINSAYQLDQQWTHWRWKMYLLRAHYDALVQERFRFEELLEREANRVMARADELGSEVVMDSVRQILARSAAHFSTHEGRDRIFHLADDLFEVIGFQPSVPLYQARNPERGAIIDFIDRPLNNEWWILSEFERIANWNEKNKIERLIEMGEWENPGPGGYYDDVGNIYKSPHVVKLHAPDTDPWYMHSDNPGFDWWDSGYNRSRLSWMSSMGWPVLEYRNLDPEATYMLRLTGVGNAFPLVGDQELRPTKYSKETGEIKEFPVPQSLTKSGVLTIRFREIDESHLNWRQHSRLNEAWLIKEK